MMNQYNQPQYQMQGQYPAQGAQKQSDPYWYRQNASYLYGVTNAPSNPMLGIEDISLKPASANQQQYGILMNGLLRTIVGSISFQVRLSKSGAPFVQTVSTPINKEKGEYWEHIILKPQIKAQILRFFEALQSGQVGAPQPQQQMYGQAPMYGQMPQQYGAPQYGAPAPAYGQAPMYGAPAYGAPVDPAYGQAPQYGAPMQQQAPVTYTPPAQAEGEADKSLAEKTTEEILSDVAEDEVPI